MTPLSACIVGQDLEIARDLVQAGAEMRPATLNGTVYLSSRELADALGVQLRRDDSGRAIVRCRCGQNVRFDITRLGRIAHCPSCKSAL